jgi:alanine dehydrogenase
MHASCSRPGIQPLAESPGRASPVTVSLLRECRPGERRVLLLPRDAARLCEICDLQVETGAGRGLGVADEDYAQVGARIAGTPDAWGRADFLLKLKAPTVAEVRRIRRGASIAALFHAEGIPDVVAELVARRITAYSFDYFRNGDGAFPLMAATGEIAGQMAVIYAAYHLQSHLDGSGVSLPACTYAPAAHVAIIGYGNAGRAAAKTALALGAEVTVYVPHRVSDDTPTAEISPKFQLLSEPGSADGLARSDVIIGALRISTFDTPPVVTAEIVRRMRAGSVIVDVTAGFGAGYIQTSAQLTSLDVPYHVTGGVKHIKIRTLPLGVHRTAAAQISRLYAPAIYRLIASLQAGTEDPAGQRGKIIAAGQILNSQVRRHYETGFRE